MTTTTSCSKNNRFFNIYKNTLRRNVGLISLLSIGVFLFYPLQYILTVFAERKPGQGYNLAGLAGNYNSVSSVLFTIIMIAAPIFLGLLLNKDMHSKTAVDVYHSLPVTREQLLSCNLAVGMTMLAIPVVTSYLIIAVAQTIRFGFNAMVFGYLLLDLVCWMAIAFVIYAMVTFIAVNVGTIFDSFVYSMVLLGFIPFIMLLLHGVFEMFLVGYTGDWFNEGLVNWSPVSVAVYRFAMSSNWRMPSVAGESYVTFPQDISESLWNSNLTILLWVLVAIGLFCVSMVIYKRRDSERAGQTDSSGLISFCMKLLATVCSGLLGGLFFSSVFNDNTKGMFLFGTVTIGLLFYLVLEAIMNRGFKTLLKSIPLGLCMTAGVTAFAAIIVTGGLGYQTRIPDFDKIASIELDYAGRYEEVSRGEVISLPTAEQIAKGEHFPNLNYINTVKLTSPEAGGIVRTFHSSAIDSGIEKQDQAWNVRRDFIDSNYTATIRYTLKNGRVLSREYNQVEMKSLGLLAPLEGLPEFIEQIHPAFYTDPSDIMVWTVSDSYGNNEKPFTLTAEQNVELLRCMQEDLRNDPYSNGMQEYEAVAYIKFTTKPPQEIGKMTASNQYLLVKSNYVNTLGFLEKNQLADALAGNSQTDKIIGAVVNVEVYEIFRINNAVHQTTPIGDEFFYSQFESIKLEENNRAEEERKRLEEKGISMSDPKTRSANSQLIVEDPALLKAMAEAAVNEYPADQPLIPVQFYFSEGTRGISKMLPYSEAPEAIKTEFKTQLRYYFSDDEQNVYEEIASRWDQK